jgi:hypothetical protein
MAPSVWGESQVELALEILLGDFEVLQASPCRRS